MAALSLVTSWSLEPFQLAPGSRSPVRRTRCAPGRCGSAGRRCRRWRIVSFAGGLLLAFIALASPIDAFGERLFAFHMAQHVLLGDLAALAIVAGLTGPVLRPVLALKPIDRLRILAHPFVALPLWALNLYLWHLPVALRGSARIGRGARRAAPLLLRLRRADVGARRRGAARAGVVRDGCEARLHRRRAPARDRARQRVPLGRARSSTRPTRQRARLGHLAARRPGARRRRDDGRGLAGDDRRRSRGCSCAWPPKESCGRSFSSGASTRGRFAGRCATGAARSFPPRNEIPPDALHGRPSRRPRRLVDRAQPPLLPRPARAARVAPGRRSRRRARRDDLVPERARQARSASGRRRPMPGCRTTGIASAFTTSRSRRTRGRRLTSGPTGCAPAAPRSRPSPRTTRTSPAITPSSSTTPTELS